MLSYEYEFFSFHLLTLLIVKQFMNYITLSVYKPGPCKWENFTLKTQYKHGDQYIC